MILQVVTDTDRRGAQIFAVDLGEALTLRGREVRTVALAPGTTSKTLDLPVLGRRRMSFRTLRALRKEIAAAEVVVGHGSTTLPACALAGLGLRTAFVYRQISDSIFWAPDLSRRLRVRAALSRSAAVVALWSGAADTMSKHLGVSHRKISVIPNGVPAASFPMSERRDHPSEPVVLYVGALVEEKGVDTAVDALKHLPRATLLVAGDGPQMNALRRRADLVASGRVRFLGPVHDISSVYAEADVLVLPSRGGDSMPAVLIEAGFSGLPCVATPVEAIVDIIRDGVTGEIVPVDDSLSLASAIESAITRAPDYSVAARQHCLARFDIGVVADQWVALLDRVNRRSPID